MVRHALTLASITLLTAACGAHTATVPHTAAHASSGKVAKEASPSKSEGSLVRTLPSTYGDDPEPASAPASAPGQRKLGDFHVYQYSGAFSKVPVTLTEQVVAEEDAQVLVVDFLLQQGTRKTALRVRMRPTEEVVRVSRMTANGETEATVADYDALMKKTEFVPDSNDQALGTEHTACVIGTEQVDCDVTKYGVTIGKKQATLSITRSAKVPGRDIGGDVVSKDGKVLYSAHLVERGNQPPVVESFAKADTRFVPEGP